MVDQDGGRGARPALGDGSALNPPLMAGPDGRRKSRIRSLLLPRNWRMRWRALAMVIIPTAAAVALGAVRVQTAQETATNFAHVNQLAVLGGDITTLAQAVEDERDLTAGYLAALQSGDATLAQSLSSQVSHQYAITGSRAATVETLAGQIGPGFPAVARTDLTSALSQVSALPDVRDLIHTKFTALPEITSYSNIISSLLVFDNDIAVGSSNAQLAQTVSALGTTIQLEDQASEQRAILYAALLQQEFEPGALNALTAAQSNEASDLAALQTTAVNLPAYLPASGGAPAGFSPTLTQVQQFNNVVQGPGIDGAQAIEQDAIIAGNAGARPTGGAPNAQAWFADMSIDLADIRSFESDELAGISAQANSQHQAAEFSEELTVAIVLALLLLVLAITIIMARSMIRPLRRLRADALDVASRRLPDVVRRLSESEGGSENGEKITIEPIGIDSTDEIGEVARAFDQVHREAVRLAGDEAMLRANLNAMFVNLSRRSQTLIERQLGIIDTLEQSEQDPDRLSNLFRLDHLATRMRRNSENLLVLAGHETPRKWSQPVPLVDVLRAAISEIEQYERITLSAQPGIVVAGRAASDVVHLVAELAENATAYSPDESSVLLTAQQVSSGGVLLDITDNGLGIPEEELAYANWRLDNPPVVDVAVSRRMGLFVVGRLASRHGIRVRLKRSGSGGVSAMIWLPDAVTESEAPPFGTLRRRFGTDAYGTVDGTAMAQGAAMPQPAVPGPRRSLSRPRTGPVSRMEPDEPTPWTAIPPRNPVSPPAGHPLASPPTSYPPVSAQTSPPASSQAATPAQREVPPPDGTGPRLPIFDAVESDWFRRGGKPIGGGEPAAGATAGSATGATTEPWTSPADDGFRAARVVASPTVGETTAAGLPKRVPNANLVPGSIGNGQANDQGGRGADADAARSESQQSAAPAGRRSAEDARGRMAGLQRGSREGRAAAPPSYWTDES